MLDDESLMLLKNPTYVSVTDALGKAPMSENIWEMMLVRQSVKSIHRHSRHLDVSEPLTP